MDTKGFTLHASRLPILLLAGLCLALPLAVGQLASTRITPVMIAAPQSRWAELGTITEPNDYPDVDERDFTTLWTTATTGLPDANTVTWDLSAETGRKRQFSFQTTADADSTTVVILLFAGNKSYALAGGLTLDDDAVYGGQLVLTGGLQVGKHSNVYVDTIVATDGMWSFSVIDSGNDRRCVVEIASDKGYHKVMFIATTLHSSSTLYVEGRTVQ